MYFDNRTVTALVASYRAARNLREIAGGAHATLEASADERRLNRQRAGGREADEALERSTAHLAKLDGQLKQMREDLAAAFYPVADGLAARFEPKGEGMDRDDFVQIGVIYALNRAHHFDEKRGTSLLSWVSRCIRNTWGSPQRKQRKREVQFAQYAEHKRAELLAKQEASECEAYYDEVTAVEVSNALGAR